MPSGKPPPAANSNPPGSPGSHQEELADRVAPAGDNALIIDCHGHYTTVPEAHSAWRTRQLTQWDAGLRPPTYPEIPDDDIRDSISSSQLRLMDERGVDLTIFSPRASAMGHHLGDIDVSERWAIHCNDLIYRVTNLFPDRFVGACQLPQVLGTPIDTSVAELRRCILELGFVACNLNPDPSGGYWSAPRLTDKSWYPLYETLCELDVPAMIHVSSSANPAVHATGAYYLNADTTAFMQLLEGDLFRDFPDLRLIIPHGGGATPYHWGRYRGLADMLHRPSIETHVLGNVHFDTCVYHQPGIDLLLDVIPTDNILFGSEMIGAVRGVDATTGHYYDDTRRLVDASTLDDAQKTKVFDTNARRVYPRLNMVGRPVEVPTSQHVFAR